MKLFIIIYFFITFSTVLNANKIETLELYLKWKHQFQFAGYYMAKEKGFYADVGLDVDFFEYQSAVNNLTKVEEREGVYAIGYPSIVLDRANKADITLLSAIFQVSPHILISLASSKIKSVKDFENKRIMIDKNAIKTVSFVAMMQSNQILMNSLQRVNPTFNIQPLIDGKVDISTAFLSNEPYQFQQKGIPYSIWDPKDYGFDLYDDILYTSQNEMKNHPQRVDNFTEATLKGWEYAFNHIEESVDIILKKYNSQNRTKEALLYEAKVLKRLAYVDNIELGNLNIDKIKRILDLYNVLGLIKQKIDYTQFIYEQKKDFHLTQEEQQYLRGKGTIKVCTDPNWMPFESFEDGNYIGISADFFKIFKIYIPLEVIQTNSWSESLEKVRNRECDVLSLAASTPKREKYLNFTKPYINVPLVLVTQKTELFLNNISSLKGKKLAITKGYAFVEMLKQNYPNLTFIEVSDIDDGLNRVVSGEFYGYIDTLATIGYTLGKDFMDELKISAKLEEKLHLGVAVNSDDPILFTIMQKTLSMVNQNTREGILNHWFSLKYIKEINYRFLIELAFIFLVIFIVLVLFYFKEKKLKEESQQKSLLLDAILNTVSEPMFYKNMEGVYENVNNAFSTQFFGTDREDTIGKTLYDFEEGIPSKLFKIYIEQDSKIYQEQKSQNYESQVKLYNGEIKDFKIQKNIFFSPEGEMLGYVAVMYDISSLKETQRYLKELASTDPLTKLYNRRYFIEIGTSLLHLAYRDKIALSLIMIDIDNFKSVNDTYGHDIGDKVIINIATIMNLCARESDVACRFGGEEFILLLPATSKTGGVTLANKLRKRIESSVIESEQGRFNVTVSIGLTTLQEKDDLDTLIKRADIALYKAKESGKNRVCV